MANYNPNYTPKNNSDFSTNLKTRKKNMKKYLVWIVVFLAIVIIASSIYVVPAGSVGVVTRFSAINRVADPGIGMKIPLVESVHQMSVRTQKDEVSASAMSENLQVVTSTVAINYHLDGTKAITVYQNIGTNYADLIIAPALQNTFKSVTAKFTAEELITNREQVRVEAENELADRLAPYNIIVENFNIVNFDFSPEFQAAIEAKQVAQQAVETSKQKLAQAQIDAQTVVTQAQGQADAQKAMKDSGSLTPEYLQYLFLSKWNGSLPTVMTSASSVFDVSGYVPNETTTQP
jgi:regulator of protease activity HflC (stomatin/prohibitin superfamily)